MEFYRIGRINKEEVNRDFRHKRDFWDSQDIKEGNSHNILA